MPKQQVILFDIDYTLFDTTLYKKTVATFLAHVVGNLDREKTHDLIEEVYYDVRQFGSFDPKMFAQFFIKKFPHSLSEKTIEEVWWQKDILQSALYPEVIKTLQSLQTKGYLLGIFSSGKTEFQLAKISQLTDLFHKDHLHIASFKEETITQVINRYMDQNLFLVDDFITILQNAKQLKQDMTTLWIKRGKFAEKAQIPAGFTPDFIITHLDEVVEIVDRGSMV